MSESWYTIRTGSGIEHKVKADDYWDDIWQKWLVMDRSLTRVYFVDVMGSPWRCVSALHVESVEKWDKVPVKGVGD